MSEENIEGIKEETKIALESILKELSRLKDSQKAIDLSAQEAAIRVSQAILKKCLPQMVKEHGITEIELMLKKVLSEIVGEPKIVIKINAKIKKNLEEIWI